MNLNLETTFHENGTVTYWSVYNQQWVRNVDYVLNRELAAMGEDEREKVIAHLKTQQIETKSI